MRKKIVPAYIATVLAIILLFAAMSSIEPLIESNAYIPGFVDILLKAAEGSFLHRVFWFFGDMTEAYFFKSIFATAGLIIFAVIADSLERKGRPFMGVPALGGSGMFWPVIAAAVIGLIITNIVYFEAGAWTPTFAPFVSTAPTLVLLFGRSPKKIVTSGVLAGFLTYPVSNWLFMNVANPLGIPGFCGVALGMGIVTIICIELCRIIPWMNEKDPVKETKEPNKEEAGPMEGSKLFYTRMLADPGEPVFWGSPLATVGLYSGAIIGWLLNPNSINYASGRFPVFLFGTLLTAATALFVWYPKYLKSGFAFTFICAVTTGSVLNTYSIPMVTLILTVIVSAAVVPALVHFLLEKIKITQRWHPCPIALICLGLVSGIWSMIIMNVPFLMS